MELKAVSAPDGRVGFGTLVAATVLGENEQEADVADEDTKDDGIVLRVQDEITRRSEAIGADYPFRIDASGRAMEFVRPVTAAGNVYLFCLFLSQAFDRTIVPKTLAPKVTDATRNLFQVCSTLAAGGYIQGPAVSFGWPRPDGSQFLKAVKRVYKAFGDGTPVRKPRVAAAKAVKDNGIDIIAWQRTADRLPGTQYLIGQVASGKNWAGKSVVTDRDHFHKYWFTVQPASVAQAAMFMPFGLEPDEPGDGTPYHSVLTDHMQSVSYKFGVLFYRDRITLNLARGLQLIENGETAIERHDELPKIVRWVENYTKRLRAA
jgi:hypothetical protein